MYGYLQQSSVYPVQKERLIYKAQGVSKKQTSVLFICCSIMLIIGIATLFLSRMKKSGWSYQTSGNVTRYNSVRGTGGYVFNSDQRHIVVVIGIFILLFAVMCLESFFISKKSYISVYDNHLEYMAYIPILFFVIPKSFNIPFSMIRNVNYIPAGGMVMTETISIFLESRRIGMSVSGAGQVYRIIKMKTGI